MQVPVMENEKVTVSRRVRIKFKNSTETIEGNIIFDKKPAHTWEEVRRFTWFTFRFDDEMKTEKAFNMIHVDTIDYL